MLEISIDSFPLYLILIPSYWYTNSNITLNSFTHKIKDIMQFIYFILEGLRKYFKYHSDVASKFDKLLKIFRSCSLCENHVYKKMMKTQNLLKEETIRDGGDNHYRVLFVSVLVNYLI
ncbi:uncharacterized protein LOC115033795 isoform X2 [Acyrthosiphon pisum]|uniref:Uncharacterized protein n=1 Tax=Acyrthosiphon pisum TaxID=7029 RepID=A0A8R2JPQ0_ACYPI|nr:uncharacterized protein LOC115033795 isoform X2 [Acyrthosiphon pisum]